MTAPTTVPLTITNNTGQDDSDVYLAITGRGSNACFAYVNADGSSTEFSLQNANNYLLRLSDLTNRTVSVPRLYSGRIYFSVGAGITIGAIAVTGDPCGIGLQFPAVSVTSDPSYDVMFDMAEFTFNAGGLNCNLTQVDAFGLPITLQVVGQNGTQNTGAWKKTRSGIFTAFTSNSTYARLVINSDNTQLRILNPSHGIGAGLFPADFFKDYIDANWNRYGNQALTITLDGGLFPGKYIATTGGIGTPMTVTLNGATQGTIPSPTTVQAFFCNGPFDQGNTAMGAVANVVATAINRGILQNASQPDCTVSDFYPEGGTYNGYSKLLHSLSVNGLAYAFGYDDQCDQNSSLADPVPTSWGITLESVS